MAALDRYHDNLNNPRPPGTGCHPWILSTANLGVIGGLAGEQIFSDIRQAIPQGSRELSDEDRERWANTLGGASQWIRPTEIYYFLNIGHQVHGQETDEDD